MADTLANSDGIVRDAQVQAAQRNGATSDHAKRRLVMCCDGTWNFPDELEDGAPVPTNVVKVAVGLARADDANIRQLLYYQSGVGTRRRQHVRGGAFGYGLSGNVRDCYRFIVENYQPGDELYFFGFSRGAYTARSTIGLIGNCGILRREHQHRLGEAYDLYKSRRPETRTQGGIAAKLFRRSYSHDDIEIRFVGVWDTVGALGIPAAGIPVPKPIKKHWGFHNTTLSDRVCNACQALAIDERRRLFKPALWEQASPAPEKQVLEQVWFAGCHRDVGGGNKDSSLSDIPLIWMVDRARRCGLAFKDDHFSEKRDTEAAFVETINRVASSASRDETPRTLIITAMHELQRTRAEGAWVHRDPIGDINESLKGLYRLLLPERRMVGDDDRRKAVADGQFVASSAVLRLSDDDAGYDPHNLRDWTRRAREMNVMDDPEPAGARTQTMAASR